MQDDGIRKAGEQAEALFRNGLNCAESTLKATADYLGIQSELIPRIATPFGAGIARTQNICGVVTGGAMAIGVAVGRDIPNGDRATADALTAEYLRWFSQRNGSLLCCDVSGVDFTDEEQSKAFRAPGGGHDAICTPVVVEATMYLCEKLQEKRRIL